MKTAIGFDQTIPQSPVATIKTPPSPPIGFTPPRNDVPPADKGQALLPEQMIVGEQYVAVERGVIVYRGPFDKCFYVENRDHQRRAHRMIRLGGSKKHPDNYYLGYEHETHFYREGEEPEQKIATWDELKNQVCEYHSTYEGR